jgi:cysteine desulfurase / selenocysteine lyase
VSTSLYLGVSARCYARVMREESRIRVGSGSASSEGDWCRSASIVAIGADARSRTRSLTSSEARRASVGNVWTSTHRQGEDRCGAAREMHGRGVSVANEGSSMVSSLIDRGEYPTLRDCVYLNQASLGLIADPAVEAMHDLLDRVVRHGNLHMSDEDEAGFLDNLRQRAARLLSVSDAEIALLSSASELLGQAPILLAPRQGSKVIVVTTDFPAITRPWLRSEDRGECRVEFVEDRPESDLTADLVERIDAHTSVVAVGWVQYATGTTIDVPRLRAATGDAGVRLVLDVTQGAGAMRCDGGSWRADLIVSSGYKWLGGPGGVAIGALAPDVIDQIPPLPGWMGAPSPFAFDATRIALAEGARRFTQSTMSYLSVAGLTTAMDQLLAIGLDRVEQHATRLRDRLLHAVEDSGWLPFRRPTDPAAASHIVSLGRPGSESAGVLAKLGRAGIVCSLRGDRLRVSLSPYNDEDDVAALAAALA